MNVCESIPKPNVVECQGWGYFVPVVFCTLRRRLARFTPCSQANYLNPNKLELWGLCVSWPPSLLWTPVEGRVSQILILIFLTSSLPWVLYSADWIVTKRGTYTSVVRRIWDKLFFIQCERNCSIWKHSLFGTDEFRLFYIFIKEPTEFI